MFEVLVASGPRLPDRRDWSARALSLGVHGALIAMAIVLTQRPPAADVYRIPEQTVFLPQTPQVPTHPDAPAAPGLPAPVQFRAPTTIEIPPVIPPVSDPIGSVPHPVGDPLPGAPMQIGVPGSSVVSTGIPLDARAVDEPPVMLTHPEPRYPEVLRQAGIEGRVMIEAVIDTTGRAEPASLRVVSSPYAQFADEARQVVLASRFRPGRVAGRAVRVRVQLPVAFGIQR